MTQNDTKRNRRNKTEYTVKGVRNIYRIQEEYELPDVLAKSEEHNLVLQVIRITISVAE